MNWTRAHDAWIAEHCEGLEVSTEFGAEPHEIRFDGPWKPVATYSTDPAACIRAAEAWVAQDADHRTWSLHRAGTLLGQCMDDGYYFSHEGEDGLAWALYRATGGPA